MCRIQDETIHIEMVKEKKCINGVRLKNPPPQRRSTLVAVEPKKNLGSLKPEKKKINAAVLNHLCVGWLSFWNGETPLTLSVCDGNLSLKSC